jgi:DNA-binding CsgD family transcriptional regulator/tetratricopeptide (TPR) repeat protein
MSGHLLLGREQELAALGSPHAERPLAVVGEAGIGKTTLLRAAAHRSGRAVFEGFGLASLTWMAYLPLARALGERPPAGDSSFVADWAAERVGDGVLLLDDLHWADPDTLELLPLLSGRVLLLAGIRRGDPQTAAAERRAREAEFELVPLGGLPTTVACALVRRCRPDLSAEEVSAIVDRAGGNPLLLEELARGEIHETLRLSLSARLHRCSEPAQEAMALLGLLGRPAEPELLSDEAPELVEAGLVVDVGEAFAPRHALLGETAAAELGAPALRRLHGRIAQLVTDPGEAARHHRAAGDVRRARNSALAAARAATRPGERARHLALAAECSTGPAGDGLRLVAADALLAAGEYEPALELLARVGGKDVEVRARAALLRSKARFWTGEMEEHRADIEEGLALVGGTGSATEVRLRIEQSRLPLWDWSESHVPQVREVVRLAERTRVDVTEAHVLLGIAHYVDGDLGCIERLRAAFTEAVAADEHRLACEAAEFLCGALHAAGDADASIVEASTMQGWCRERGLRTQELLFGWLRARAACLSRGPSDRELAALEAALGDPALGARADQIAADLANALTALGRIEEARVRLDGVRPATPAGAISSGLMRAELEWAAGRPLAAVAAVAELDLVGMTEGYEEYAAAAHVTRGWALLDLGRPVPLHRPRGGWALAAGAAPELEALASGYDAATAHRTERLFGEAAALHAGQLLQWELRCLWGAAEAARAAGDRDRARRRLLKVEERCAAHGLEPLLGRVRGSLRRVGIARATPRGRSGPGHGALSTREREVMELVAAGRSTAEIARRLGLSPATVESQVRSAMAKLGAKTRLQAALFASQE